MCDNLVSFQFLNWNLIRYQEKSISQIHNLIKNGIKLIRQDLFSIQPGWLTLIISNACFCPSLPVCGCCLPFQASLLIFYKWAHPSVPFHGQPWGLIHQCLQSWEPWEMQAVAVRRQAAHPALSANTGPHPQMPNKSGDSKPASQGLKQTQEQTSGLTANRPDSWLHLFSRLFVPFLPSDF